MWVRRVGIKNNAFSEVHVRHYHLLETAYHDQVKSTAEHQTISNGNTPHVLSY